MKKNITVNLFGRLYAIDEDAYNLLHHYTTTLRAYYLRHESSAEVAEDIECRIAELLDEMKANGVEAFTIEHIENIIRQIGELKDLAPEDAETETHTHSDEEPAHEGGEAPKNKAWYMRGEKLFRDPKEKMMGGVLSGVSKYFGVSALLLRVAFILLVIFCWNVSSGFMMAMLPVWVYLLMCVLVPMAKTPADFLQMNGKAVNPQNLGDEVIRGSKEGGASVMSKVLGAVAILFFVMIGSWAFFAILVAVCAIVGVFSLPVSMLNELIDFECSDEIIAIAQNALQYEISVYVCAGCVILAMGIVLYASVHAVLSAMGKAQDMSSKARVALLIAWIVAVAAAVGSGARASVIMAEAVKEIKEKLRAEDEAKHTHYGFYFNDADWEYFTNENWKIITAENTEKFTAFGNFYGDNPNYRYLDAWNYGNSEVSPKYTAERCEEVEPGMYTLHASARAKGDGAYIYLSTCSVGDSINRNELRLAKVPQLRDGEGLGNGWTRIEIDSIQVKEPMKLYYGVSTDRAVTGKPVNLIYVSAAEFYLEPKQMK